MISAICATYKITFGCMTSSITQGKDVNVIRWLRRLGPTHHHIGVFGGRMSNTWYPTSIPVALQFLFYAVPAIYGIQGRMLGCSHFNAQSCVSLTNVVESSIPSQLKSGRGSDVYCSSIVSAPYVCSFIAIRRWIEIFRCQLSLRCRQVEIVKTVTALNLPR